MVAGTDREALTLQRPLPDYTLRIVGRGEKRDQLEETGKEGRGAWGQNEGFSGTSDSGAVYTE